MTQENSLLNADGTLPAEEPPHSINVLTEIEDVTEEETFDQSSQYDSDLLDMLHELEEDSTPKIVEIFATHMYEASESNLSYEECLAISQNLYNSKVIGDYSEEWESEEATDELAPTFDSEDGTEDATKETVPSESVYHWDITNVVNKNGDFYTRRRFSAHPPLFMLVDSEGNGASIALSQKTTRELAMSLNALERIYEGKPPVEEDDRTPGITGIWERFSTWWMKRKVMGSLVVLMGLAMSVAIINTLYIMMTA